MSKLSKVEQLERDTHDLLVAFDALVENHPPAAIVNMLTRTKQSEETEVLLDKFIDIAAALCNRRAQLGRNYKRQR